jgi:hypothetical protein
LLIACGGVEVRERDAVARGVAGHHVLEGGLLGNRRRRGGRVAVRVDQLRFHAGEDRAAHLDVLGLFLAVAEEPTRRERHRLGGQVGLGALADVLVIRAPAILDDVAPDHLAECEVVDLLVLGRVIVCANAFE